MPLIVYCLVTLALVAGMTYFFSTRLWIPPPSDRRPRLTLAVWIIGLCAIVLLIATPAHYALGVFTCCKAGHAIVVFTRGSDPVGFQIAVAVKYVTLIVTLALC